mmetsp:Transcript_46958/g.92443  ORF Transcript_46958/g.92443 Transcript_46958/m.92443 type:complete len:213 (-) Transcript_46958:487-1125(-)
MPKNWTRSTRWISKRPICGSAGQALLRAPISTPPTTSLSKSRAASGLCCHLHLNGPATTCSLAFTHATGHAEWTSRLMTPTLRRQASSCSVSQPTTGWRWRCRRVRCCIFLRSTFTKSYQPLTNFLCLSTSTTTLRRRTCSKIFFLFLFRSMLWRWKVKLSCRGAKKRMWLQQVPSRRRRRSPAWHIPCTTWWKAFTTNTTGLTATQRWLIS